MALHSILGLSDICINVGVKCGKMNPENECVHQCEQEFKARRSENFANSLSMSRSDFMHRTVICPLILTWKSTKMSLVIHGRASQQSVHYI